MGSKGQYGRRGLVWAEAVRRCVNRRNAGWEMQSSLD